MKNIVSISVVVCLVFLFSGCSWVDVTPAAQGVRTATAQEVVACKPMGSVSSKVLSKVGFVDRNEYKVAAELEDLARDQAAKMGGNVIVPDSEAENGQQSFLAYRC
jgi:hypothetical protein